MIRWPPEQPDLFGEAEEEPLSRIEHYGWMDAGTGYPAHGLIGDEPVYGEKLSGERRAAYEAGYRRRLEARQ